MSVTFGGMNLESTGAVLLGRGTYGGAERDIEQIHIPGRSGDILLDKGDYKNVEVTYPCGIQQNFDEVSRKLKALLYRMPGYRVLTDSYHPDEYRMAEYRGPFEPKVYSERGNDCGEVDIVFQCKPRRYLYAGDEENYFITGDRDKSTGKELILVHVPEHTADDVLKFRFNNIVDTRSVTSCKAYTDSQIIPTSQSWDITAQVQRGTVGNREIFSISNMSTNIQYIEIEFSNPSTDLAMILFNDRLLHFVAYGLDFGVQHVKTTYAPKGWLGEPTITVSGIKTAGSDSVVIRYMGARLTLDISGIETGKGFYYKIDSENKIIWSTSSSSTRLIDVTQDVGGENFEFPVADTTITQGEITAYGADKLIVSYQTKEWRI